MNHRVLEFYKVFPVFLSIQLISQFRVVYNTSPSVFVESVDAIDEEWAIDGPPQPDKPPLTLSPHQI